MDLTATSVISFVQKQSTLHSWLSLVELALSVLLLASFCVGIYNALMMNERRLLRQLWNWKQKLTLTTAATVTKFLTSKLPWLRFSRKPTSNSPNTHPGEGRSRLIPTLCVTFVAALIGMNVQASYKHPGNGKVVELHNVKVLRDIGRYDYWLETKDAGKFYTTFCADYEPQFSAGQTLTVLKYEDRGICWSVANTHPAYKLRRNPDGTPTTD